MREFEFHVPTKILFGVGAEGRIGEAALAEGVRRVLVLYGGGSAERSGLLDRVRDTLAKAGIACFVKGGVKPNPLMDFAEEAVWIHQDKGIDLVLAVGGGSVMDTAKAVSVGLASSVEEMRQVFRGQSVLKTALGVGAVVTMAASGSETSPTAVLSDGRTHEKLICTNPLLVPRFAILNPELTYTTPPLQTACGVADILMHTLERYCADLGGNQLTDTLAEALLRTAIHNGRLCMEKPNDYDARSELMWCGSLSHNGLTGLGRTNEFPVHRLGHELAARYNIPHGMSLTILWPHWANAVRVRIAPRLARLGREVFGITKADENAAALSCIETFDGYFKALGLPTCFAEAPMGVEQEEVLGRFAANCTDNGAHPLGVLCPLNHDGVLAVYRSANGLH